MALKYTICFCRCRDRILLLHRNRPPNQYRWNGLGGKLEPGEDPLACIFREIAEEADIDLAKAAGVRFTGVVTWPEWCDPTGGSTGMYAFVADLPDSWPTWEGECETPEGRLAWKPVAWVCDERNRDVVENIPRFLPTMLTTTEPREYVCDYRAEGLVSVEVRPLPFPPPLIPIRQTPAT